MPRLLLGEQRATPWRRSPPFRAALCKKGKEYLMAKKRLGKGQKPNEKENHKEHSAAHLSVFVSLASSKPFNKTMVLPLSYIKLYALFARTFKKNYRITEKFNIF